MEAPLASHRCLDLIEMVTRALEPGPEGPLPASTPDGATVGLRLTGSSESSVRCTEFQLSGLAAGHLQGPVISVSQVRTTSFPWSDN